MDGIPLKIRWEFTDTSPIKSKLRAFLLHTNINKSDFHPDTEKVLL